MRWPRLAVILAAIYLLWSYQRMAYGPVHHEHKGLPDVSLREVAIIVPVLALLLVFGVYPKILTDRIDPRPTQWSPTSPRATSPTWARRASS